MIESKKLDSGSRLRVTRVMQDFMTKQRILSGITPSGDGSLHIGNYLGAVKQFIDLAQTHECFLMVADLHALTTVQNKAQLQANCENLILNELALLKGFLSKDDFNNLVFFRQSDVPYHTELQSILNNVTPLGLIKRAHAYKDKLAKDVMEDDINMGLFSYPVLMAADILLYRTDLVPVGKDQKQHVEIARDIAQKFNSIFGVNTLKLPQPHIPEEVAMILGTDGQRKMSKSLGNLIGIFIEGEVLRKQVNSCYTDPSRIRATDPGHVEGNMVFSYLDFFGDKTKVSELKKQYEKGNVGDRDIKEFLFEILTSHFAPAREAYRELKSNHELIRNILRFGAERARSEGERVIGEVRKNLGLVNSYSFFDKIPL
jgi:tryptophanyl-tRNA synthetase